MRCKHTVNLSYTHTQHLVVVGRGPSVGIVVVVNIHAHTYTHMYPRILYAYAHKDTRAGRAIYNLLIAYSTAHHLRIDYTYCVCTTTGFRFVCVCACFVHLRNL